MDKDIKTWLYDILQSIKEIDSYYDNKPRIFEEYITDIKTKRAIERNLEIIGKTVNRILKFYLLPFTRDLNKLRIRAFILPKNLLFFVSGKEGSSRSASPE